MLETPYLARSAKLSKIQSLLDLDGLPNMSCQDVVGWVSLCGRLSNNNTLANESNRLILPVSIRSPQTYFVRTKYVLSKDVPHWSVLSPYFQRTSHTVPYFVSSAIRGRIRPFCVYTTKDKTRTTLVGILSVSLKDEVGFS